MEEKETEILMLSRVQILPQLPPPPPPPPRLPPQTPQILIKI